MSDITKFNETWIEARRRAGVHANIKTLLCILVVSLWDDLKILEISTFRANFCTLKMCPNKREF